MFTLKLVRTACSARCKSYRCLQNSLAVSGSAAMIFPGLMSLLTKHIRTGKIIAALPDTAREICKDRYDRRLPEHAVLTAVSRWTSGYLERSARRSTGVSPSTPFLPVSRYSTKSPFLTIDKRKQYGEGELQRLWAKYGTSWSLELLTRFTLSGSFFVKSWSMNSATDARRSTSINDNLFFYV